MQAEYVRAVLLDVEGTTSSIAFVKEQLFPFARRHIPAYVRAHESELQQLLDQIRRIEGRSDLTTAQLIDVLLRWISEDRKLTPLKTLQGLVWKQGFDSSELAAHVYPDAVRALRRWHERGLRLYIYSSGSVAAQQQLLSHTPYGDLTAMLAGYFDTATGSKLEADSYRAIAAAIAVPADAILFLSDHPGEIQAASLAGLRVVRVDREAAVPGDTEVGVIGSFDAIA